MGEPLGDINGRAEERLDDRINSVHKEAHGRMDRIETTAEKTNDSISLKLETISNDTKSLLVKQESIANTVEHFALKINDHDKAIDELDTKRETGVIAMTKSQTKSAMLISTAVAMSTLLLAAYLSWVFSKIG